jgi:hypothetical protein
MTETRYRRLFAEFLNDYWGAFHEVLEAQSVNPHHLAPPLFDALTAAHERFTANAGTASLALAQLGQVWTAVAERRLATADAPLTGREIRHARLQFEAIYDHFAARGALYPRAAAVALASAAHAHPRAPLRADAAR